MEGLERPPEEVVGFLRRSGESAVFPLKPVDASERRPIALLVRDPFRPSKKIP